MGEISYDVLKYPASVHRSTEVSHLQLVGELFGMRPTPAASARVLEIGCGVGTNLLSLAERFPGGRFVGVDLSAPQIAAGEAVRKAAGLDNVELRAGDATAIDASLGEFDYILAHGFYSWVPPAAAEGLLAVIGGRLTPHGIAFVSYDCKPGAYMKAMTRDAMRFHTRGMTAPAELVSEARRVVQVLHAAAQGNSLYQGILDEMRETYAEVPDDALHHDDLSDSWSCHTLTEFMDRAAANGLAYLGDSDVPTMSPFGLNAEAVGLIQSSAHNIVEREQYVDFVKNRRFRSTLLCRAEVPVSHGIEPRRITSLWLGSRAYPRGDEMPDPRTNAPVTFASRRASATIRDPLAKAALLTLIHAWPQAVAFGELVERVAMILEAPADQIAAPLAADMLKCFGGSLVELYSGPSPFTLAVPERPRTSGLARVLAAEGGLVPTLAQMPANPDAAQRKLLALLDGTRDLAGLAGELGLGEHEVAEMLKILARLALIRA